MKKMGALLLILSLTIPFAVSCRQGEDSYSEASDSSINAFSTENTSQTDFSSGNGYEQSSSYKDSSSLGESSSNEDSSSISDSSLFLDSSSHEEDSSIIDSSSSENSSAETFPITYYMCLEYDVMSIPAEFYKEGGNYPVSYTEGVGVVIDDLNAYRDNGTYRLKFCGWYLDKKCSIPFDGELDEEQAGSIVLYAKVEYVNDSE